MTNELIFDFASPFGEGDIIEHGRTAQPGRLVTRPDHATTALDDRATALEDRFPDLPARGDSWHVVSDGSWDLWSWVLLFQKRFGYFDEMLLSTWIITGPIARRLVDWLDNDTIREFHMVTDAYFKSRDAQTYHYLTHALITRGLTYAAFKNHAKVTLLHNAAHDATLAIIGSANMTQNPRTECYVLTNDPTVYTFHKSWILDMTHR
jgi:hypothetical protein